jgi:hypothetical protein
MRCGSCGAKVDDPEATFCSRCGVRLERSGSGVAEEPQPDTNIDAAAHPSSPVADHGSGGRAGGTKMVREIGLAIKHSFDAGGWGPASSAAALGFLAVLGVGAAFIGVLKIYDPGFGVKKGSLWIVERIVISGLASLGIPIEQARAEGAVLALGALLLVGWVTVWAARNIVAKSRASTMSECVIQGTKVGVPLALMIFVAALAFRVRGRVDVGADPLAALVIGGVWGALFGAAGGAMAHTTFRDLVFGTAAGRPAYWHEGLAAAIVMVATATVLAGVTVLVFLIVDLAVGSDVPLRAGDALAIIFLTMAFAPNIVAGTLAFAIGAPLNFVAQSLGVGVDTSFSLLGAGGQRPDWYVYPLLLIPLCACLIGGYVARKRSVDPSRSAEVIGIAACAFGLAVALLAFAGGVSLDRAFLGQGSLLVLKSNPSTAFALAFLWAAVVGAAGWKLANGQTNVAEHSVHSDK